MSMQKQRSTIVLVHGGWHGSWCWERVVPLIEAKGCAVRTIDLPSIGAPPGKEWNLTDEARVLRKLIDDIGGPVLLCAHSYGGMVISLAAVGHPNVKRLVYLCAFMPDANQSLSDITGGGPEPWILPTADGRNLPDLAQAKELFYGDCDDETAERSRKKLLPMPNAPFMEGIPAPAWLEIPSTYVVCSLDKAIPVWRQREVFAPRASESLELVSSHSPFFSVPGDVAELLAART